MVGERRVAQYVSWDEILSMVGRISVAPLGLATAHRGSRFSTDRPRYGTLVSGLPLREPGWNQEGPEVQPSHPQPEAPDPADRLLTVPNVLSLLRLAGVPLFLWLLLGPHYDLLAMLVLALSGLTDWLDGKLARLLNQSSRLGELLDPAVDRLYTLSTLLAFGLRGILPW